MHTERSLALLGAGVMGSAVLRSILRAGLVDPSRTTVTTLDPEAAARWAEAGVTVAEGNAAAVAGAEVIIVAVKPPDVGAVLDDIAAALAPGALVVSLAAGVRLDTMAGHLSDGQAIVRVMPNTPALLGEGVSAVSPGPHCTPEYVRRVEELLGACGEVVTVPEKQQDIVTAVSGSGPAYVFAFVEALVEGAVSLGMARATATQLAVQTVYGAATMMREPDAHPGSLREAVTSPGGTTAAALREFERHGLRSAVISGVEAAAARSAALGA